MSHPRHLRKQKFKAIFLLAIGMTTQAYCINCKKIFNAKDGFQHVLTTYDHRVHFIDATDPKSREAHLSMGLAATTIAMIEKEQTKTSK
jgi:hypothetical protein